MGCGPSTYAGATPDSPRPDATTTLRAAGSPKKNSSKKTAGGSFWQLGNSVKEPKSYHVQAFRDDSTCSSDGCKGGAGASPHAQPANLQDLAGGKDPTSFAAAFQQLCRQKVSGSFLATLAEHLQDAARKGLPGYLRSRAQPTDAKELQLFVAAATVCADSVLSPVLAHIGRMLSSHEASASSALMATDSAGSSWEQLEFSDFLGVLEASCNAVYDVGVVEVGRPVALLLETLHQVHSHCTAKRIPLAPNSLRISAVSELLSMLGIIFFRRVVIETHDTAAAKLEEYHQLREQMGWADEHLALVADPQASAMLLYLAQVSQAGEKRVKFVVRRSCAFWDALEAAQQQRLIPPASRVTCCKVFPSFVDEYVQGKKKPALEAGEGHGPRKEFFALAGEDMAGQPAMQLQQQQQPNPDSPSRRTGSIHGNPPLWVFNRTAGSFWYNSKLGRSEKLERAYGFAGWLMGQCVVNRAPLGLLFPPVLFKPLLQGDAFSPSMADLAAFDPAAAASVRQVAGLPPAQLAAMLEMESLPTTLSAEQYMRHAARQLLVDDVEWQCQALAAGFFSAMDRKALRAWAIGAAALSDLVMGGSADGGDAVDVRHLFRISLDGDLAGASGVLVELLWEVLEKWPPAQQRRFVEFVTGSARLPLPGSELLKIQAPFVAVGAAEHAATLGMLPQAHTCDNLLELPNYWESLLALRGVKGGPAAVAQGTAALSTQQARELRAEAKRVLDGRLSLAVNNFEGYGLDETSRRDDDE